MVETKEWVITAQDRCDGPQCSAQAYVIAKGVTGELYFCGHHYKQSEGEKLSAFAYEIIDERERLVENRLQGDD